MQTVHHSEGLVFMNSGLVEDNSVDLILTDPPYIISHETGMNKQMNDVKRIKEGETMKSVEDWLEYKKANGLKTDEHMTNYIQYGSTYGKKYCVRTDYGDWDSQFTMEILETFIKQYYKKLRMGGTLVIWFDLWKLSPLKEMMERCKFKQLRMIEWIKTNPQPLNASVNYLTNCREIALIGVKGSKPTFHGRMDRGIYEYPMAAGFYKFHPTQKNLQLFEALICKHSNEGDLVMDTFLGGGTTALAAKRTGRRFIGCEVNPEFVEKIREVLT
jgi:DNA modification methylase